MTYGMVINLKKCVGCQACAVVCKEANGTPPGMQRAWVERLVEGTYPNVRSTPIPQLCNQCVNAPCVEVCPSGASVKGEDGIVTIDKEVCIGCQSCVMACPYGARTLREGEEGYFGAELNAYEAVKYAEHPVKTVDKCDFCKGNGRLEAGEEPACVAACITGARIFGQVEELMELVEAREGYQLLPEQGTEPQVWYLPRKYNV